MTAMLTPRVVPLADDRVDAAAAALARAFHDDPLQTYTFPDEDERRRLSPLHFAAIIEYGLHFGEVFTSEDGEGGACVWLPPHEWEITPERAAQTGLDRLDKLIGKAPAKRFLGVIGAIESFHQRDVPSAHWYTLVVGVDPSRQGTGLGRALLQPILSLADADRLPCYLETSQPKNVSFYEHLGFRVLVDMVDPKSGLRLWTFRRESADG